jgi:hypothetical protein
MVDPAFSHFVLVGGTSLSLQLGHRISVDLDMFTNETFNENDLSDYLRLTYRFELDFLDKETVKGEIEGVKIDCIAHKYPWLHVPIIEDTVRLAGFDDMAAMKLNAIVGNGTRIKDFIDVAFMSGKISLNEMLSAYENKYRSNALMALKALTYYGDIHFDEPIRMLDKQRFDWRKIEKQIAIMIRYPDTVFESSHFY